MSAFTVLVPIAGFAFGTALVFASRACEAHARTVVLAADVKRWEIEWDDFCRKLKADGREA